jgi:gliding motility-associated-like protein
MLKPVLALLFCTICIVSVSRGQRFAKCWENSLSATLTKPQVEWLALDPDTLLDVVLTGQSAAGELMLLSFQNIITGLDEKHALATGFKSGIFQMADWNHDNRIDVLISGKTLLNDSALTVFVNNGDFTFTKAATPLLKHGGPFWITDLNADGLSDIIVAGKKGSDNFIGIYENSMGALKLVYDSLNVLVRDVAIADFNSDGLPDFVVSGDFSGAPATVLFMNKGHTRFAPRPLPSPLAGPLSAVDQDEDGLVDLFVVDTQQSLLTEWRNDGDSLILHQTYPAPLNPTLFAADMTSDGIVDKLISGTNPLGNKVSFVQDSSFVVDPLDTTGLVTQRAGDFDRDGDLDILQLLDSVGRTWMKILRNKTVQVNRRPSTSGFAEATFLAGPTLISWAPAIDDHDSRSLTYDVWLGTANSVVQSASFDLITGRRLTATAGNAGTQHSKVIRGLTDNRYFYKIQTVDNAYNGSYYDSRNGTYYDSNTGTDQNGAVCTGSVLACFDLVHETIQACGGESISLRAASRAQWFSVTTALLATDSVYKFTATQSDTLISFVAQGNNCSQNKIWIINVHDKQVFESQTIYACQDQVIKLEIASRWKNIEWSTVPAVVGVGSITQKVTGDMKIVATALSSGGCPFRKEFKIKVSKPTLSVNGEVFGIMKGLSVHLQAFGSGVHFSWAPSDGLDNQGVPDPIATPLHTTNYTVTVTDSVGCQLSKSVLVQVAERSFIPNMFSPNGDERNDRLLIYGLAEAIDFHFQIFNREGAIVYETNDPLQASTTGWNGYAAGSLQPSGVYYWKVEGQTVLHEPVELSGKRMGSILLVH